MFAVLPVLKQNVPVPWAHACIISWHTWDIRATLMHHIYLLFITGRMPAHISVTIVFTAIVPVYFGILNFSLSLILLYDNKEGRDFHLGLLGVFLQTFLPGFLE